MKCRMIAFLLASHAPRSRAFVAMKGTACGLSSSTGAAAASTESAAAATAELLPPSSVLDRVFETDDRPVILFDGVCNLCNNAVNLALDWDPKGKLRFSALQSDVGRSLLQAHGRAADDISSIVLVRTDGAYTKSDAILGISEELNPLPFVPMKPLSRLASGLVPQFLRDLIYDGVADNRYSIMGIRDECRFDADGEFDDRFVDDGLASGP
mmetsp:Transcript_29565/g.66754  ORF Transcript_29565/g.66754 Transcript_29565/m.66754 type:complete len:211 (+) Transcript_29565:47-679(+)